MYELSKPDNNEKAYNEELEKYINKNIILFGGKYRGRILYTEIYQK
jgi:hypothetical protein